jgi:cytochrome c oxidase subunit 2
MLTMLLAQSLYLPPKASTVAPEVDTLFNWILGVTAFFCLLIFVTMAYFAIKYRHRPGRVAPESTAHSTALELTWTIIPIIIVLVIFYYGFKGFLDESVVPPNAYEVNVHSQMWSWGFVYPNGFLSDELHVPKGRPIRLVLTSSDVVHSLYMPAMRVQKMTVPGRYNRIWIEATKSGTFPIYCAQYCGTKHSEMLSKLVVHDSDAEFQKWLADASDLTKNPLFKTNGPKWAGEQVMKSHGCFQCHSTDGKAGTGPTLKDVFGSQVVTDHGTITADENYVHESVLYPQAKIVKGFGPVMPSFLGTVKDNEIGWIIAYLKSISTNYKEQTLSLPAPGGQPATAPASGASAPAPGASVPAPK